ncbi:putative short chain dehydrogenase family protein [Toxoplasma gondii MAS]|uniref:Short chain dehydrogenase family protein,putative n=7 Tax=Toxoplasma gondii TaxID=5811 RepID=A0A0F7V4Y4_TOXGV|nr:putative short chain dehydrogenase family protein [Toxoplasma gondii MAS]PIL96335.1 putative short chain dehydrogenase family protein [Toxoplasma gondii COUG]PUA86095.1 putative short chain dehydrogenase family protein [Toxoplasma gondii TgCATBr9]RQX67982.1 putative short chain dehydrogenase family protein [Toxoplasma gondii CAST]CEL76282.1 TPA: short chain dehydrogenase family protein,putative [Toxoplasma gondii VEG]
MNFAGRRYLIFGSRGAGAYLARRLLGNGAKVHVCSRREESLLHLTKWLDSPALSTATCDAMQPGQIAHAVHEASRVLGGALNGVVYAVGSIPLKSFHKVTRYELVDHFTLNAVGAFEAVQAASFDLLHTNGAAVLFSTFAARRGFAHHAIIAPAKAAVEALTYEVAAELAPHVRVNCIAPSLVNTSLAANLITRGAHKVTYGSKHPLNRIGEPDDLAAAAAFLLSDDASWITGQVINVDGGRSTVSCRDEVEGPSRSGLLH